MTGIAPEEHVVSQVPVDVCQHRCRVEMLFGTESSRVCLQLVALFLGIRVSLASHFLDLGPDKGSLDGFHVEEETK